MPSRIAALLLLLGSTALSLAAPAPTTRDSAGVRITENPSRFMFPVNHRLASAPSLDVGGLSDNPDEEFDSNQGYLRGVRLSDGGLAAIDVNRVMFFDRTGKLVKIVGRDGDGPGEFRYITSICRTRGDTIVVGDRARLGVIDGKGNFVRHLASTPRNLGFDSCFGDGTVMLTGRGVSTNGGPPITHLWRVRLNDTTGTRIGELTTSFDFVTQAEITEVAAGNRLYIGDAPGREIRVYQMPAAESSTPMRQIASIRSADRVDAISNAEAEERMPGTIPTNVSDAERTDRMDRMKAMPRASEWPAFGRIHVDPAGNLWVEDYRRVQTTPPGWSKFDPNGRLVGRLVLPAPAKREDRLQVIGFAVDEVLVRRWDEDGATRLVVWGVVEGGGRVKG